MLLPDTDAYTAFTIRTIAQRDAFSPHCLQNCALRGAEPAESKVGFAGPALETQALQLASNPFPRSLDLVHVIGNKFAIGQRLCQAFQSHSVEVERRTHPAEQRNLRRIASQHANSQPGKAVSLGKC